MSLLRLGFTKTRVHAPARAISPSAQRPLPANVLWVRQPPNDWFLPHPNARNPDDSKSDDNPDLANVRFEFVDCECDWGLLKKKRDKKEKGDRVQEMVNCKYHFNGELYEEMVNDPNRQKKGKSKGRKNKFHMGFTLDRDELMKEVDQIWGPHMITIIETNDRHDRMRCNACFEKKVRQHIPSNMHQISRDNMHKNSSLKT